MWGCSQCYHENDESATVCLSCGAARGGRRFQQQRATINRAAQPGVPIVAPARAYEPIRDKQPRVDAPTPELPPEPTCPRIPMLYRLSMLIGALAAILLPLTVATFAWRQYPAIRAAIIPLLIDSAAPAWCGIAAYAALSLVAVLLSLIPGLWTMLFAKRLTPRRHKRPDVRA